MAGPQVTYLGGRLRSGERSRRFMSRAARMLTSTATPRKANPPTTPANTGWGRGPGSCVREGVNLQAWARGHEEGRCLTWGSEPPVPRVLPSCQVLTRSGDVGCVTGITDIATREGHERAEFVENILGMGVQEGVKAPFSTPSPFGKTLQLEVRVK